MSATAPVATAPVAAVDGPSGVGKGTLCRWLADQLGWHLLDSGALYRLTALAALDAGLDLDRGGDDRRRGFDPTLRQIAETLDVRFVGDSAASEADRILLAGKPVGVLVRSEACGNAASKIAAFPEVREALLARQRAFRRPPGLVADGRDMGTVVFPNAEIKIFLQASAEERAKRRYKQLKEKGISASLAALAKTIAERDERDATRAVAPLRPAADAFILDTDGLGIDAVRQRVLTRIKQHL